MSDISSATADDDGPADEDDQRPTRRRRPNGLLSAVISLLCLATLAALGLCHLLGGTFARLADAVWAVLRYPFILHAVLMMSWRRDYADLLADRVAPQVHALVWSARHPRLRRRYRALGARRPWATSRLLTLDEIVLLGWDPGDLCLLVDDEVERQRAQGDGRFSRPPGRPTWDVHGLAAWTARRPGEAGFLIDLDSELRDHVSELCAREAAEIYLGPATDDLSPGLLTWLQWYMVDVEAFSLAAQALEEYVAQFPDERGDTPDLLDSVPERGIGRALAGEHLRTLSTWELRGWLEHAESFTRNALFRKKPLGTFDPSFTWTTWSCVAGQIGEQGAHPVLWKAAGFNPSEIPGVLAGEIPVPRTTLEAMAALRQPQPRGF